MVKKLREDIQKEVYLRLCFFDYNRHPELKPEQIKHIEKWLENDPKSIHSENLFWTDGWVTRHHVEQQPCPYGAPEAHRGEYLKKDPYNLIEFKKFTYTVKKPNQKNRQEYSETVYRLRRNIRARERLKSLIRKSESFWMSDYIRICIDEKEEKLFRILQHLRIAFSVRMHSGTFGTSDKQYLTTLLEDMKLVETAINEELESSQTIPKYVRDSDKARRKQLLKDLMEGEIKVK